MTDHVYKQVEITGTSSKSAQDAVERAIAKAALTVHNLRWFQVIETRGAITKNKVSQWQVTVKIGFTLED